MTQLTHMATSRIEELLQEQEPFRYSPDRDHIFFESMRESFLHHFQTSTIFKKLCYLDGFSSELFLQYEDIFYIPHFFVPVLRSRLSHHLLDKTFHRHIPLEEISNPTGKSAMRLASIITRVFKDYASIPSREEANLLMVAPKSEFHLSDPQDANVPAEGNPPPVAEPSRIDGYNEDSVCSNPGLEQAMLSLRRFSGEKKPLCIYGTLPALNELRREYTRNNMPPLHLGETGFLFLGNDAGEDIANTASRQELSRVIAQWLNIPPGNVREVYTVPGHDIPYCRCEAGHMHISIYSRVVARDPESLRLLPDGSVGVLHFYAPYAEHFPTISLLSTDLGITAKNCSCGRNAPYLEPARRKNLNIS